LQELVKNWIPTIQKNKSDVEQGLKEISKLSVDVEESMQQQNRDDDSIGQVQQELKYQQEAID
jgi:peptidoglycan hydrolase CwlO-like protein